MARHFGQNLGKEMKFLRCLTFLELCSQLRPLANESCGHSVGAARAKDDSGMKNRAKANELTFIRQLQGLRCLTVDYSGKKEALLPYLSSVPS